MRYRRLVLLAALAAVVVVASVPMAGQAPQAAGSAAAQTTPSTPARTAWGDPDLRGIWRNMIQGLPFERPKELGEKAFYTDEEVAAMVRTLEEHRATSGGLFEVTGLCGGLTGFVRGFPGGASPGFSLCPTFPLGSSSEPIRISRRTSAVIDPPNGRLPPWTPEAIKRYEARVAARADRGEDDSYADRGLGERCIRITGQAAVGTLSYTDVSGAPTVFPSSYNPVRRILQMPGYVAMVMDERGEHHIIPLDGRPAPGPQVDAWLGVQRGHWEGNTLVVETTNINDQQDGGRILPSHEAVMHPGSGETLRIIERFTRLDADTLEYRYTVGDPAVYTRPFTVLRELTRDDGYVTVPGQCQENNEGFVLGMLASGQADELGTLEFAREASQRRLLRLEELKAEWAEFNDLYPGR